MCLVTSFPPPSYLQVNIFMDAAIDLAMQLGGQAS